MINQDINNYKEKSLENLSVAEKSFSDSKYNASVNRAYFSCFQAACAILLSKGYEVDNKSHKWIQSKFNLELIHNKKILISNYSNYLYDLRNLRNIADYKPTMVSKKDANLQLKKAKEFAFEIIERIK